MATQLRKKQHIWVRTAPNEPIQEAVILSIGPKKLILLYLNDQETKAYDSITKAPFDNPFEPITIYTSPDSYRMEQARYPLLARIHKAVDTNELMNCTTEQLERIITILDEMTSSQPKGAIKP